MEASKTWHLGKGPLLPRSMHHVLIYSHLFNCPPLADVSHIRVSPEIHDCETITEQELEYFPSFPDRYMLSCDLNPATRMRAEVKASSPPPCRGHDNLASWSFPAFPRGRDDAEELQWLWLWWLWVKIMWNKPDLFHYCLQESCNIDQKRSFWNSHQEEESYYVKPLKLSTAFLALFYWNFQEHI